MTLKLRMTIRRPEQMLTRAYALIGVTKVTLQWPDVSLHYRPHFWTLRSTYLNQLTRRIQRKSRYRSWKSSDLKLLSNHFRNAGKFEFCSRGQSAVKRRRWSHHVAYSVHDSNWLQPSQLLPMWIIVDSAMETCWDFQLESSTARSERVFRSYWRARSL